MTASNLDAVNLADANLNGVIAEDVMNQIWDVSKIPLPFTDMVGTSTHDNPYFEWRTDKLQAQNTANAVEDGADATGTNNTKVGRRIGNHSQISTKEVYVSHRANAVDTIGYAQELAYQLTRRQQELRRDVEGMALLNQASVASATGVAPRAAGLMAWLTTADIDGNAATTSNVFRAAGGADGGWDATASNGLVAAATPGTSAEALTETKVRDVVQSIYEQGGGMTASLTAMTTPDVKRKFSEYLFTSSARIASLIADGGGAASQREGSGSVDVFLTDFGTLNLVPNRLQPEFDTGNDVMFILDPSYLSLSYLEGYRTDPLAKSGLSEKRMMSVDWSLCVKNWDALGAVYDIDPTAAVTFS